MRALLISIRGIEEVEFDNSLEDYYRLIDCQMMTGAGYPDNLHAAWVDDEGMLTMEGRLEAGERVIAIRPDWYPQDLVGNMLITGFDHETGESTDATMLIEELEGKIQIGEFVHKTQS